MNVVKAIENEIGADAVRNLWVKMKYLKDIIGIRGVKRKSGPLNGSSGKFRKIVTKQRSARVPAMKLAAAMDSALSPALF